MRDLNIEGLTGVNIWVYMNTQEDAEEKENNQTFVLPALRQTDPLLPTEECEKYVRT